MAPSNSGTASGTADEVVEILEEGGEPTTPTLVVADIEARGLSVGPGADLSDSNLEYAQLGWRNLRGANMSNCVVNNAVLSRATLIGANLSNSSFTNSDFYGARLQGSRGEHSIFENCNMAQALFNEAVLVGANFKGAFMEDTEFKDADLRGANFSEAHIEFTDFSGSRMAGAEFIGASLHKVTFDTQDSDYESIDLHQAVWSDPDEPTPLNWMVGNDGKLRRSFEYIIAKSARPDLNAEAARMLYDEHPELNEAAMLTLLGSFGARP